MNHDQTRALNQLACLISGRQVAIDTNHLDEDPIQRIEAMQSVAKDLLSCAAETGDMKALNQAQRKIESLTNLLVLAGL